MDAYKIWEFFKNWANEWPLRGKFMTKIRNFDSFGGCIPHFCPNKHEIWHGEQTEVWHGGVPRAKFHVYRGNVSPMWGGMV